MRRVQRGAYPNTPHSRSRRTTGWWPGIWRTGISCKNRQSGNIAEFQGTAFERRFTRSIRIGLAGAESDQRVLADFRGLIHARGRRTLPRSPFNRPMAIINTSSHIGKRCATREDPLPRTPGSGPPARPKSEMATTLPSGGRIPRRKRVSRSYSGPATSRDAILGVARHPEPIRERTALPPARNGCIPKRRPRGPLDILVPVY